MNSHSSCENLCDERTNNAEFESEMVEKVKGGSEFGGKDFRLRVDAGVRVFFDSDGDEARSVGRGVSSSGGD